MTDEAMNALLKDMSARLDQEDFPDAGIKALALINVVGIMLLDILGDPTLVVLQLRDAAHRTEEIANDQDAGNHHRH